MESIKLPETLDGHWSTPEGRAMAERYANTPRERIALSDRTDFDIANAIYMADRTGLDLIVYQTSAKDRIRWLSAQLALANAQRDALRNALHSASLNLDACAVAIKKGGKSEGRHTLAEEWAARARDAIAQATGEEA